MNEKKSRRLAKEFAVDKEYETDENWANRERESLDFTASSLRSVQEGIASLIDSLDAYEAVERRTLMTARIEIDAEGNQRFYKGEGANVRRVQELDDHQLNEVIVYHEAMYLEAMAMKRRLADAADVARGARGRRGGVTSLHRAEVGQTNGEGTAVAAQT